MEDDYLLSYQDSSFESHIFFQKFTYVTKICTCKRISEYIFVQVQMMDMADGIKSFFKFEMNRTTL